MSKGKSITLLSIISVLVAFLLVMTFIRFPIGVKNYNSVLGAIDLDYDLEGGTAYTLTLASDNEEEVDNVDDVISTLEYRLNALGYSLYSVKAIKSTAEGVKDYDVRIETKSTDTLASDINVVAAHGEVKLYGGTSANPTTEILEDVDAIKDSQYLGSVSDGQNTYYQVSISFTDEGYNALHELIHAAAESESGGESFDDRILSFNLILCFEGGDGVDTCVLYFESYFVSFDADYARKVDVEHTEVEFV